MDHDDVTCGGISHKILKKTFCNATRFNSENINATTIKLSEKFDNPFSHIFIFANIFVHHHDFDVVTVTSDSLSSLIRQG